MRVRFLACMAVVLVAGFVISRAQESKTTVKREAAPMVFWRMTQGHEEQVQMRIANLNHYLESLQEK